MSLVPLLLRDYWVDDFDMPLIPRMRRNDLFSPLRNERSLTPYTISLRPWERAVDSLLKDDGSKVKIDKDKFEVIVDVQQFNPKEINVKVTDDNYLVVEGKHEEKQDEHGYVSRQFSRRYKLPEGVNPEHVKSALSSDGLLTLTAPLKALPAPGERTIPIQHIGKRAKNGEPMQVDHKGA